ncbi:MULTISPECIES: helix-turn-helix domain-containing protein [Halolamina]|uniref:GAF and HTH_10 associated domain-containing protein n=1 Tax=Halolamina pelagica TaxID=699431 RepID=A0A1I5MTV8_9EURY|nr:MULTISPECIES: helix-turn-helix domain-containing protein [Halolamina]NHX36156.1 helix-turn-helix domain-containing protein [Halolamina sp. R1-12]SFP12955.1 GAF and HTH_10 associated domain-containing protein [Halolamina pelagica]
MPEAKLTLTIPERTWPGEISRTHDDATIRILAAMTETDAGVGLAEIAAPDPRQVLADVRAHDSVDDVEVLQCGDDECLLQFRTHLPLLLLAARDSGLPLEMPFEIRDGDATWTLTAAQDAISELGDQLSALGIAYTVDYLQQEVAGSEELLTDRQRAIVRAAIERGYYDTPRECSLTELADAVGLAKSTASETLHRAEERVMKEFAAAALEEPEPQAVIER